MTFELDGKPLNDAQRLKWLADLHNDDVPDRNGLERIHAGEFWADGELSLIEPPETKFYNEQALSYRFSEAIRQTHRAQRQARRRAMVKYGLWCAWWCLIVCVVVWLAALATTAVLALAGVA